MVDASKTNVGKMKCPEPECDGRPWVKINGRRTVSWKCPECEASAFAKHGEAAASRWLGKAKESPEGKAIAAKESQPPTPTPTPTPTPARKQKPASLFGGL